MTRAYYPWPSAYAKLKIKNEKFKIVKVIEAEICKENNHVIGEVFLIENNQLAIKCGTGGLIIKKLQLEGGKILTTKEFLNGHKYFVGSILE